MSQICHKAYVTQRGGAASAAPVPVSAEPQCFMEGWPALQQHWLVVSSFGAKGREWAGEKLGWEGHSDGSWTPCWARIGIRGADNGQRPTLSFTHLLNTGLLLLVLQSAGSKFEREKHSCKIAKLWEILETEANKAEKNLPIPASNIMWILY